MANTQPLNELVESWMAKVAEHDESYQPPRLDVIEMLQACMSMTAAIESYAKCNGWTELSEGIIQEYERMTALIKKATEPRAKQVLS